MALLFASGRVVDCILVFMLLEALALMFIGRRGRGIPAAQLTMNLAAGAALLLALRAQLTGASWPSVAMWLIVALLAHVRDLMLRWTASPTNP